MVAARWDRILGGVFILSALVLGQAVLPISEETLLRRSVFDAGHVLLFGAVALGALAVFRSAIPWPGRGRWLHYALALVLVIGLGVATEILQIFASRDPGLGDFGRDLLGGAAALFVVLAFDRHTWSAHPVARVLLLVGALSAAVWGMAESAWVYRDYLRRDAAFPRLCTFDAPWESRFVRGNDAALLRTDPPAEWTAALGQAGCVEFDRAAYPGLWLSEPVPDWTGYAALEFEIWSEAPAELFLRVHDRAHDQRYTDRYNRALPILAGANHFRIPLAEIEAGPHDRRLDLREVAGVAVFAAEPAGPLTVWFDEFRLVPPAQEP